MNDWREYPLNYHFWHNDDDVVRIELSWTGCWDDHKEGWLVGETSVVTTTPQGYQIGGGRDIVVFDKEKHVTDLDKSKIVRK